MKNYNPYTHKKKLKYIKNLDFSRFFCFNKLINAILSYNDLFCYNKFILNRAVKFPLLEAKIIVGGFLEMKRVKI
ncbi:hypothetical protein psyc5s11_18600 [Clostridium gelidum]|uniref:Uncharacterized protein n=1 Tax=Clostridium gelidum TaxID=704125 RepID=A0ABN6IW35_9CLOT|nr:hypothetical protein psyc5s11_18600 [Clostridium gelidum]